MPKDSDKTNETLPVKAANQVESTSDEMDVNALPPTPDGAWDSSSDDELKDIISKLRLMDTASSKPTVKHSPTLPASKKQSHTNVVELSKAHEPPKISKHTPIVYDLPESKKQSHTNVVELSKANEPPNMSKRTLIVYDLDDASTKSTTNKRNETKAVNDYGDFSSKILPDLVGNERSVRLVNNMSAYLEYARKDVIFRALDILGRDKLYDIYEQVQHIEASGGMALKNPKVRCSSSELFNYFIKEAVTIEDYKEIFQLGDLVPTRKNKYKWTNTENVVTKLAKLNDNLFDCKVKLDNLKKHASKSIVSANARVQKAKQVDSAATGCNGKSDCDNTSQLDDYLQLENDDDEDFFKNI